MKFEKGVRVESIGKMFGTVVRHVDGQDGGSYRVDWDNGCSGLIAPCNIQAVDPDEDDHVDEAAEAHHFLHPDR